ncbi:MAG: hypothetical protein ACLR0U_22940 [Enterocloster clostridioformis]
MILMKYLETLLRFLQYTTGISAVCWDGTNEMLEKLEQKHCFSPQAQPHLVAREHRNILESLKTSYIYEMEDLLGVHLVTFLFQNVIVLVGPFVTETWDDGIAKIRLIDTALSASHMLLYKRYFCSYNVVDSQVVSRNVSGAITALLPAEPPASTSACRVCALRKIQVPIPGAAGFWRCCPSLRLRKRVLVSCGVRPR